MDAAGRMGSAVKSSTAGPSVRPEGRAWRHPQRSPSLSAASAVWRLSFAGRFRSASGRYLPELLSGCRTWVDDRRGVNSGRKRNGESENQEGTSESGGRKRQRSSAKPAGCAGIGEEERMCGRAQSGVESPETAKPRGDDPTGFRANKRPLKLSGLNLAPPRGLEPRTLRLTAACSTS